MFTGIVTAIGRVDTLDPRKGGARLTVTPTGPWPSLDRGESVSVSGVCLTALARGRRLSADLSAETLRRSNLGALSSGTLVNLERALRHGERISGHFVLGHVDGISVVREIRREGNSWLYRFTIPAGLSRFVVEKGSVALDGVSLTVAARGARHFSVAVIPETRERTTLGTARAGARVNFEVDVFARYGAAGWRRAVGGPARRRSAIPAR